MTGFQNNVTEMFLLFPLTKIAKMVNKMDTRAKNRKMALTVMRLLTIYLKDFSLLTC